MTCALSEPCPMKFPVAEVNRTPVAGTPLGGFTIFGTVPGAFSHPALSKVGLHIMYHDLAF